jgi:hypothetical protein
VEPVTFGKYQLEQVFRQVTDELKHELVAFWLQNNALVEQEAQNRASQACWIARGAAQEIVAVCTLAVDDFGKPPAPHYYCRAFIREADRKSGLGVELVRQARITLAESYRPGQPEQGLVVVNQNPILMQPAVRELFRKWGWSLAGRTQSGYDVWRVSNENMYPHPPKD